MLDISKFFQKFRKLYQDESEKKEKLITIVKEVAKVELTKEQVSVKDGIVFIVASPIIRNEIVMKKPQILSNLATLNFQIKDIR